jgi:endonuclease/exonuclease/phosphatase family metal-dependent hydrolase
MTVLAAVAMAAAAAAQLRVVTHNVTNYAGGFTSQIQNCYYGSFQSRSLAPDAILVQEFLSTTSVSDFKNALNTAPGSPGDWESATFVNGNDTDSAFFYRTSRVAYMGHTIVSVGSSSNSNHPRNVMRYDFRPIGYSGAGAVLACYSSHMKAGTTDTDKSRRLIEAQKIRANAETLNPAWNILLGGDFNMRSSTETAYQELVGSKLNNQGRFFDPIKSPGTWYDSATFRFIHTQDPATAMDDRFDQILLGGSLVDGFGFDYLGNPNVSYSTTTWNDPNHSYRAWGNDGTSFNLPLKVANNTMVGSAIAQAIVDLAAGQGHIPVFLDLKVPPKVGSPTVLDLGNTFVGGSLGAVLTVGNVGDVQTWTSQGIGALNYSLSASQGFSAPPGNFVAQAGTGGNGHLITVDTSTPGKKYGVVVISSNDPDQPTRLVQVRARVIDFANRQ